MLQFQHLKIPKDKSMQHDIESYIWDSFEELSHLFPSKVADKLRELKEANKKSDFNDDLSLIFGMNNKILKNIENEYLQKLEGIQSIDDMIKLLDKYPYSKEYIEKANEWIDESVVSEEMGSLFNSLANSYYYQGEYDKALPLYGKALKIREEVLGDNHPDTATSYDNLASLYKSKGEYDNALPLYQKALKIEEEVLGENHPDTATGYNNLAELYRNKGEYDKALPLYEKSLKIREDILGENHPDTANSYNNLASFYQSKGEYDKALPLYAKALKIREEVLGENHSGTATIYNNLASIYQLKGEYDKALPFQQKALKIREEVLGDKHSDTANSYNNLAELYRNKGEYDKALPFQQKALKIGEEVLGDNHSNTAIIYNNLALLYNSKGEYDKALPLYAKSLKIREEVLGENHTDTASSYNNLALLYSSIGEYHKALPLYEKALRIYININGIKHPNSQLIYNNLIAFKNNFFIDSNYLEKPLYIDKVKIENFKLLKDFEMKFTKGVNIIIGENSSGKTSLLQAITLGLSKKGSFDEFNDYEKYITKSKIESKISLFFDGYEKNITIKSNGKEVDNNILSPFVVAYGSNIFTKYKLEVDDLVNDMLSGNIKRDFTTSIFEDYLDTFHNPKSILNKLNTRSERKAKRLEKIFRGVINRFIEGFTLEQDRESQNYFFRCTQGNIFKLENLSEGYRNSILLISDILVKIYGIGKTRKNIEGVILIDEFDRHLHPKWQSNLVSKLHKLFPKIQFILTTHNPMSIMDREAKEVTIIREVDGELKAINKGGTQNIDVCGILLEYFGVDTIVGDTMQKNLKEITKIKLKGRRNLTPEDKTRIKEIEKELQHTPATDFIYNRAYLNFLIFLKENKQIDFDDFESMKNKEMVASLEEYKGLF